VEPFLHKKPLKKTQALKRNTSTRTRTDARPRTREPIYIVVLQRNMRSHSGEITSLGAELECGASPSREWRYSTGSDVAMPVGMDESVGTSSSTGWATASGRNSFFSSDCSSSNWSSNRSSATSSDEGRKATRRPLLLGAGLLELYPSGTIEKPRQHESAEWDNVMRENQRWPYPVEQQGACSTNKFALAALS
jgi:hypothetical protein